MKRIAVVGATGAVGRTMLALLAEEPFAGFPIALYGSGRSRGARMRSGNRELPVRVLGEDALEPCDIALFSAGSAVSREYAPRFAERGAIVIDNSSAFRMDPGVPLVVPEINARDIRTGPGIIANPNCSAIIMLLAVHPLLALGRCRISVATYQAVSGAGQRGLEALRRELAGEPFLRGEPFPFPIAHNVFPLIGDLDDASGATGEETKMALESRKILGMPDLEVFATCVRIPVERCHSEAITLLFERPVATAAAERALRSAAGVCFEPDPRQPPTPRPLAGEHAVWVGRLRAPRPDVLQLWAVGDQLLKGAALNAVQIARAILGR
ncbi:MAG: aspartate-semialdehyde dehydrogenase [Planctomycetes bacterium]|nr:aspartate-semialdehyde dehydrogenase [Planctomycetota bacterium]